MPVKRLFAKVIFKGLPVCSCRIPDKRHSSTHRRPLIGNSFIPRLGVNERCRFRFYVRLKPSFTLELGLRWEWNMSPTEAVNRSVNFFGSADSLVRLGT
jgi:hypothetical protein